MENNTTFEWFDKLREDGTLPTIYQLIQMDTWTDADSFVTRVNQIFDCRIEYVSNYSWALMSKEVVSDLAKFFDGTSVLSVCSGNGYIEKCITDENPNIDMICTDTYEWQEDKESCVNYEKHFFEIERLDAVEAVKKYNNVDYVLMSWPPYASPLAKDVLNECIKFNIPLVYIGEWEGGYNADGSLFDLINDKCSICYSINCNYVSFYGIHDAIHLITPN